jgi:hypothetical protein
MEATPQGNGGVRKVAKNTRFKKEKGELSVLND